MMDHSFIKTILEQKDRTIYRQEKVIKKLQKRVKEEQRKKNQLVSQLKRSLNKL
ncbi:hypothetical protein [Enterococcus sp. LJL99]